MSTERLTDEEFDRKVELYTQFDKQNDGATSYLKTFLEEQDRQEAELNTPDLPARKKELWEEQLDKDTEERGNSIINNKILEAEFGNDANKKSSFSFVEFVKDFFLFPFRLTYGFFEWYVSGMTLMKGITLCFFAFTTIFCGWIAFHKVVELFCDLVTTYTPMCLISPIDSAEYVPWMLLAVVWVLPFLIHFMGKYVFVFLPILVLLLVVIEIVIGDPFFTDAFCSLIDVLTSNL